MLDSLAVVLLVFMGLRDDRLAPGTPHTSLFRMRDIAAEKMEVEPEPPAPPWDADWNTLR